MHDTISHIPELFVARVLFMFLEKNIGERHVHERNFVESHVTIHVYGNINDLESILKVNDNVVRITRKQVLDKEN